MSYCGGLQYYCKLGARDRAGHICYVCRRTQEAGPFQNQQSYLRVCPGESGEGQRGGGRG
uniref:Uncharacterized protein n=1 Tax=Sphenodon punctatus TaxID=8508 RepID=A0A8D0HFI4_SPHPU